MTIKMYANYGELAHEYTAIYAYVAGDAADLVSIDMPNKYQPAELTNGGYSVVIPVDGEPCEMDIKDALNHFAPFRRACTITKL